MLAHAHDSCIPIAGDVQLSDPLTIPATARNATIDNLHPGRSYYCVLAVTNEVGSSTSQTVNATVMEEGTFQDWNSTWRHCVYKQSNNQLTEKSFS